MSASSLGERVLALLGSVVISALLWAPIASPAPVTAAAQVIGHLVAAGPHLRQHART